MISPLKKHIFFLTIIVFFGSCNLQEVDNTDTHSTWSSIVVEKTQEELNEEIVRERIETIRKRLALKWLIIEWDSYFRDWQLPLALNQYLNFYKENPNDDLIKSKIWDTYFEMNKFSSARKYYNEIEQKTPEIEEKIFLNLWYTTNLNTPALYPRLLSEIETSFNDDEIIFYSKTLLSCLSNFHECKKEFWYYFWPSEKETNAEWEFEVIWESDSETSISYPWLQNIKNAIVNYRNFWIDDVSLKDAYILWALFEDKMYTLSIKLWEQILEDRPWYKPVVKIIAQSHFYLWDYEAARDALWDYYENDDEDPAVAYMLWVTNTKLREYVLANIYFSKSLALDYNPSVNAYRQLIHNYYVLEDEEKIRSTFKNMVKFETEIEDIDLALWIYYHILGEEYQTALTWSKRGQELYPENSDFYGYEWWVYREQWKNEASIDILETGLELDSNNPFVIINLAYSETQIGNTWKALVYFKKVLRDFQDTEFAIIAEEEIVKLSN